MKPLNIYYCSQSKNTGYDTYDSCIVISKDEESARNMNPGAWNCSWCSSSKDVQVELIGKAIKGQVEGVILSSFNAG